MRKIPEGRSINDRRKTKYMNYEQKYKEALERARTKLTNEVAADIFPELAESGDERIRKFLTKCVKENMFVKSFMVDGFDKDEVLAWLEKQGEQKSAEVRTTGCWNVQDIEQKPAEWSEEDEKMLESIIEEVRYTGDFPDYPTKEEDELYDECLAKVDWLNSLKDRVQPQPKQEWSKEDEAFYQRLEQIVCKVDIEAFQSDRDLHSWLKSLRPQSTWKPTEQQMKVLNEVINFAADHGTMRWNDYIYNVLKGLREQLKKL